MSKSELLYRENGTVAFEEAPDVIVATWKKSGMGAYDVSLCANGEETALKIHDSPRSLVDDYIRTMVEMTADTSEQQRRAA